MAIFECVGGISPTGNALPGDVKEGVSFSNENDVDLVGTFAAQEKIITSSRDSQIVVPDEGKYLSKVTVNGLAPSGTFTPTSRAANIDMGAKSNYRYVTTEAVPNKNTGTYTYASGSTGGTVDLGETNTYRYVNAGNVYNTGYGNGYNQGVANMSLPNQMTFYCSSYGVIAILNLPLAMYSQYNQYAVTPAGPNNFGTAAELKVGFGSGPLTGSGLTPISGNTAYYLDKSQAWMSIRADHNPEPTGFAVTFYK